jgi:hypothetical protein
MKSLHEPISQAVVLLAMARQGSKKASNVKTNPQPP